MRRAWPTITMAFLAVALAGCSTSEEPVSEPPATISSPNFSNLTPLPTGFLDEDTGETYTPHTEPQWDAASRKSAVTAGEEAMRLFARPTLDQATWWEELSPLMNDVARKDYAYVQPQSIPANKVTGPGKIVEEDSASVVRIEVPTNAGTYVVILNRTDADSPWKIARYIFPEKD